MSVGKLFLDNENVVRARGLADKGETGADRWLNSGVVVTASVLDGNTVIEGPIECEYVDDSNGDYVGVLPVIPELVADRHYRVRVDVAGTHVARQYVPVVGAVRA
jgi:hypothetical protein